MEDQLWNLFCETGDPMGYLLYAAEKRKKDTERPKKTQPQPQSKPELPKTTL